MKGSQDALAKASRGRTMNGQGRMKAGDLKMSTL
jgi:hypothetical protein